MWCEANCYCGGLLKKNFSHSQISKHLQSKHCFSNLFQVIPVLLSFAFITHGFHFYHKVSCYSKIPAPVLSWCFDHKTVWLTSRWSSMFWLLFIFLTYSVCSLLSAKSKDTSCIANCIIQNWNRLSNLSFWHITFLMLENGKLC